MGVEEAPAASLPVIDFSKPELQPGNSEWDLVKSQVRKALEEYGCFKALFNVPVELRAAIFSELTDLFDLPSSTKQLNVSAASFRGYMGQLPGLPLYESLGFEDPLDLAKIVSLANVLWPNGRPNFSKTMQAYALKVSELEKTIRRMILESFGLERLLEEQMRETNYLVRVSKYEGSQTKEAQLGLTPHLDHNMVTILHQNDQIGGLELQTRGGEWMDANLSTNSFLVLLGQSFHAWSNGRFHAPYHRVVMSGEEARYSIGLFSSFRAGYMITTPEELVDQQHPLLFKPFDYFEYLKFVESAYRSGLKRYISDFCGA